MNRLFSISVLSLFSLFFLASCANSDMPINQTVNQAAAPLKGEQIAVIKTNKGVIKFKFFPEVAPETVKNFQELAKKGFYNGLIFHRVIPDFMIQGGDPAGNGTGGETYKGPGTALKAEFSDKLNHIRGAVSMARKGGDVDSATSQFFIVQNKAGANFLDGQYTIFGQTFEGLGVVDAIANAPRSENDMPKEKIIMESVTIE